MPISVDSKTESSSVVAHVNVGGEIDSKTEYISHDFREEINSKLSIQGFISRPLKKKEGNHYVKGCLLLCRQAPKRLSCMATKLCGTFFICDADGVGK